ncbi:Gfo/Idh/MocA family protein [candidate division KSB1 bacterium]
MTEPKTINRREFIKRSSVAGVGLGLAAPYMSSKVLGANNNITVGIIGVGARAHQHIDAINQISGVEVVAVCDAYKGRNERAVERTGGKAKIYKNYKEIISRKDVDTIIVATPDHLHKKQILDSLDAGKDVYCEKPLTYSVDDGPEIIAKVKQTGRIMQVGSQGMASIIQGRAKEIIASGKLGQITMIRASYNRNTASGAWIYPIPPDASPKTVDWDMFLGSAPKRPFDLPRFFQWRCFWDYSGGIATDLFVHLCTTINYIMGAKVPQSAVAMADLYRWKESRDVPDTVNGALKYKEGFTVNLSGTFNNQSSPGAGFHILGTEGSIILGSSRLTFTPEHPVEDNRWVVRSWASAQEKAYYNSPEIMKVETPASWQPNVYSSTEVFEQEGLDATVVHFQNFFDSVRARKQPVQDAAAGHHAAACAHMINISSREERFVEWDDARDTVKKA